jgi:trimethylamine--corrinoid protein Co-methyltransferase
MEDKETQRPMIKYLTDAQIEAIHEGSLEILEKTGIKVELEPGLKVLDKAGAKVDYQTGRATIPRELVAQCLETVPRECWYAARNPAKDCHMKRGGRLYSRTAGSPDFIIDLETDEWRPVLIDDVHDIYTIMDWCDGISIVTSAFAQDWPKFGRDILMLRDMLDYTDKHIHLRTDTIETFPHMLEMATIVAGGRDKLRERPIVSLLEGHISPLRFIDVMVNALLLCGEYGIPLEVCCMPMAGSTGPVTMVGNLQLLNTEFLAGVVISQSANPGAPLVYAPRPMLMDLRTGFSLAGSIDGEMAAVAGVQMAHFYDVPVSVHGQWSDSVIDDDQNLYEHTYTALLGALSGANILVGAGSIQETLSISHVQLIVDDEINQMCFRALEGFVVDKEHRAVEAINRVGPGGNFLADMHTAKFCRGERYTPYLAYRGSIEGWVESGKKTMRDRAKDKAREILKEHKPNPLPEEIARELDKYVEYAFKQLQR